MRKYLYGVIALIALLAPTATAIGQGTDNPLVVAQTVDRSNRARNVPSAAASGEVGAVTRVNNWTVGLAGGLRFILPSFV